MPTINELLGSPAKRSESIADILGEEPRFFSTDAQPKQRAAFFNQPALTNEQPEPRFPELTDRDLRREQLLIEREQEAEQAPTLERIRGRLSVAPLEARAGLKSTVAGLFKAVNAPPILGWLFEKSAEKDAKDAEAFGKEIGGGKPGDIAQMLGSTAIQSLPSLAAAPLGLAAAATTAGVQTFGSVTDEAERAYREKGDPEALNKARAAGALAGVVTAGLTRYIPGGSERLMQGLARGEITREAGQGIVRTILKEALQEFPEEALDQASQGTIAKLSYRPELTWTDIADDSFKAGLTGSALAGLIGGAAGTAQTARRGVSRLRRTAPVSEPTTDRKQRDPEVVGDIPIPDRINAIDTLLADFEKRLGPRDRFNPETKRGEPIRILDTREQRLLDLREQLSAQLPTQGGQNAVTPQQEQVSVPPQSQSGVASGQVTETSVGDSIQRPTQVAPQIQTAPTPVISGATATVQGGTAVAPVDAVGKSLSSYLVYQKSKGKPASLTDEGLYEIVRSSWTQDGRLSAGTAIEIAFPEATEAERKAALGAYWGANNEQVNRVNQRYWASPEGQRVSESLAPAPSATPIAALPVATAPVPQPAIAESGSGQPATQKFRIGRSPQLYSVVEELTATPIEIQNNDQAVRVRNDRTGETQDVLKSQLVPVQTGTGVKAAKVDLDAELAARKLDPSVFPNAKAKRAAIDRHDAIGSNRQLAETIAAKLEGIKSGKKAGDLHLFGVVSLVWDTAINIAQATIRAGGSVADAVQKAIDYIRANNGNAFDEPGATEFLKRSVEPQPEFQEPTTDEAEPATEGQTVNIAGRTYEVADKMKLTPEQRAAGDAKAKAKLRELGIPGAPDTTVDKRAGSIDNNTVYRVIPDGSFHDEAANKLRDHLIEQIQIQNSAEGDPSYVSSLINAINMNFDFGNWQNVISQPVLESLLNISVGESSRRGTLLRQIRGISNDIRAVAQNAALRLKWVYQEAFDPDGLVSKIIAKVREVAGENATIEEKKLALYKIIGGLNPSEKAKVNKTKIGRLIEKVINSGMLDDGEVFKLFAKDQRWTVPTDREIEQMRKWRHQEAALLQPTPEEVRKYGSEEAARAAVEAATLDARKELLRKMNTQWSRWTQPLVNGWRDLSNPEKVKNTNSAFNEWVAANLLLKLGFGIRQVIDVGTQMMLNTPTRALGAAFGNWNSDKRNNRDSHLQHDIAQAFSDAYRSRLKVLGYALNSFKQTLKGKGEQKQVEQLISSIGIFDRMLMNANTMRERGMHGAAYLLEVFAIATRMGRQFAAAMDVVHGIPAETQEIAHQVRNALREKGLGKEAVEVQFNNIMGLISSQRAEALSMATELLQSRGIETTPSAVERAAWHILRSKVYDAAQQAGLPADEWKKNNAIYRDLIGWNISETKGLKGVGGPGGLVALGGKAAKEMLSRVPLVGGVMSVPFTFSNAMGIAMNRKLAWSPLGFFPGIFKGSPHWEGEANIRQRKIEAALGTGINGVIFSLILSGVWKALPAFWPKDEKERDKWVKNGWSPGMVIVPFGNNQEIHLSTRTGPLAFFAPTIAAAGAYQQKQEERAKKQSAINERAAKLGIAPEQLPEMSAADWLGVMGGALWSSLSGGRTASGALAAYTDFGNFNVKKAGASAATAILPGMPALNEFGRLAGGSVNPKMASFWDLMVPLPTSEAQRVNMLGDPMRDENDYRRIVTILTGGNFPFPTQTTPAETQAYATLFNSEFRPPAINPSRANTGEEIGNCERVRYCGAQAI